MVGMNSDPFFELVLNAQIQILSDRVHDRRREPHRVRIETGLVEDHRLEEEVRGDVAEGVTDLLPDWDLVR